MLDLVLEYFSIYKDLVSTLKHIPALEGPAPCGSKFRMSWRS